MATVLGGEKHVLIAFFVAANFVACAARPPSDAPRKPALTANGEQHVAAPSEERFALTRGSERVLGSLRTVLRVDVYVQTGLPQLDRFVRDLSNVLWEYRRQSEGKFEFRMIEADTLEARAQAKREGLVEQPFVVAERSDQLRLANAQGYMGLVIRYQAEKTVIPSLPWNKSDGLEFWISTKMRETIDKAHGIKHRVGVLAGKDELKLSDHQLVQQLPRSHGPTIKGVIEQAFPFYRLDEVDLKGGTQAIDPELAGIIITQPRRDYLEPELRLIDDFLMLGDKSLVVYASAVNLEPGNATMMATLSTRGLEPLLDGYGIHMNKDAVFDHGSMFRVQVAPRGKQVVWLSHPGIPLVVGDPFGHAEEARLDTGFAAFFRLEEVLFPFSSSLTLLLDRQPSDVQIRAIARSTPSASVDESLKIDMKLREQWQPKSPREQRILAAYAWGKLASAFKGSAHTPQRAPRPSRVLLISSSLFLTNPFIYASSASATVPSEDEAALLVCAQPYTKYLTSTILAFKNSLDWLTGDNDLVAASSKPIGKAPGPVSTPF